MNFEDFVETGSVVLEDVDCLATDSAVLETAGRMFEAAWTIPYTVEWSGWFELGIADSEKCWSWSCLHLVAVAAVGPEVDSTAADSADC